MDKNINLVTIRVKPFEDESLESYLTRYATNFSGGVESFLRTLKINSSKLPSTYDSFFPTDLSHINLLYAKVSSKKRLDLLRIQAGFIGVPLSGLLKLAIGRTQLEYSPRVSAVISHGHYIPRTMVRSPENIPFCPACLIDKAYIRQIWHFEHYNFCHIHEMKLQFECQTCRARPYFFARGIKTVCPECKSEYPFPTEMTSENEVVVAKWLAGSNGELPDVPISSRWGLLHWFFYDKEEINYELFVSFFIKHEANLSRHIHDEVERNLTTAIRPIQDMAFHEIFGEILQRCWRLPSSNVDENVIFSSFMRYLVKLLDDDSTLLKCRLNAIEVSMILNVSIFQVATLYEQNILTSSVRLKSNRIYEVTDRIFRLSDVLRAWIMFCQTERNNLGVLASKW